MKRSRSLFHWTAHRCSLRALTGQDGVFLRAASATVTDARGMDYTAVHSQPAWTWIDGVPHLLLGPDDRLYWPYRARPRAMTAIVRFVELGSAAIDGARLIQIGAADDSAPKFLVAAAAPGYAATYEAGDVRTASLSIAPVENDAVEIEATFGEYGELQLFQNIPTEDASQQSETLRHDVAWSDMRLYVNGVGSGNTGVIALESIELVPAIAVARRNFGRLVIDGEGYSIEPGEDGADAYFVEDGDGYSISPTPSANPARILMRGSTNAEML